MNRRDFIKLFAVTAVVPSAFAQVTPERIRRTTAVPLSLPQWFEEARVQGHTRLPVSMLREPQFSDAGKRFHSMGASVFCRHIKTAGEGAWWRSNVGAILPVAQSRNLVRELVDEAHDAGCKILAYYRHMEDAAEAERHPDWICRNWQGEPLATKRGLHLCFSSPYRDFVERRLVEAVGFNVDGFYFDEMHMPAVGCWCDYCRSGFQRKYGEDLPALNNPADPVWHRLTDYINDVIVETFSAWRTAVHSIRPECVFVVSSHKFPAMTERHISSRLCRISDSVKTEFNEPLAFGSNAVFASRGGRVYYEKDVKMALGWCLVRDAASGRPPHVWIPGLQSDKAATSAAAAVIAHGGIANIDVQESNLPDVRFQNAFKLSSRIAPVMAGFRPLRWLGIYYSEAARDRNLSDPMMAMRRSIFPVYGAFRALLRRGMSTSLVTDPILEAGEVDGYTALYVPDRSSMPLVLERRLKEFEGRGGLIIAPDMEWRWDVPSEQDRTEDMFLTALARKEIHAPIRVEAKDRNIHVGCYQSRIADHLIVIVCNDFSWVWSGVRRRAQLVDESTLSGTPPDTVDNAVLFCKLKKPVLGIRELMGDALLPTRIDSIGQIKIQLPAFDVLIVLEITLG